MLIVSGNNNKALLAGEKAGNALFLAADDSDAIRRLWEEAGKYEPSSNNGRRLDVTLLLESSTSLWLLQSAGVPKEINDKADIVATTKEDLLAKSILVKLPGGNSHYPSLDRKPVSRDSDTTVHLVLFGFTPLAEALAINTALVAHYPNYCRDTRLRTRITIIDSKLSDDCERFILRFANLFDNSWYRTLDLNESEPKLLVHKPIYAGKRKDFVDIEWEFVRGNIGNSAVRQKLAEWSQTRRQQLTVAFCHEEEHLNLEEALSLPEEIYNAAIPILCYSNEDNVLQLAVNDQHYKSIIPVNYHSCDIKLLGTLRDMGRRINYVYNHCFSLKPDDPVTAPASIDMGRLAQLWQNVGSLTKQYSNIFNAMTLGSKMHSICHDENDWKAYYALSKDEIDTLTEVEHNRWNVEELILGYRPCTDDEQKMVERDVSMKKVLRQKKIHYDLRAYDDLRSDSTGKNVNVYDMALTQAIPLIIKSCITD